MDIHIRDKILTGSHSTETVLNKAVNLLEHQLNSKESAIATLMDIEYAFNHTSSEVVKAAMTRQGSPYCLQRGVLYPLLWSLVADELYHLLTGQGCHPIGYSDDILVIVCGMHLVAMTGVMQLTLKVVNTWCRITGLGEYG